MLSLTNVKLLRYNHTPISFGAGLRYKIEKRLSITGALLAIANTSGVKAVVDQEQALINSATDYQDIYLNGILFGNGKITQLNFSGAAKVREGEYAYEVVCYEEGNLFNATGGVYQGISWASARRVDSLTESLTYDEDEQGNKSYTHSVAVRFAEGTATDEINLAIGIARELFNSTSGLGAFLGGDDLTGVQKYHTESYNSIDGSCSFTESAIIPNIRAGNYSYALSYTVSLGTDGYTLVTENCIITGVAFPKFASAVAGKTALWGGAYARANAVYGSYAFSTLPLFTIPISQGSAANKFDGTIEITSSFSNNPRYRLNAIWEYTITIDRNEQNYITVSENGSIAGVGRAGSDKFSNAVSYYATVKGGIDARLFAAYANAGGTRALLTIAEGYTENKFEGRIVYARTRTDNNLYSSGNIKKMDVRVDISYPVHLFQHYNIFNQKEILQTQSQSTPGKVNVAVKLRGKRGTPIATYLAAAQAAVQQYKTLGADPFMAECGYSFSPNRNSLDFTVEYIFTGHYKSSTDLTLT